MGAGEELAALAERVQQRGQGRRWGGASKELGRGAEGGKEAAEWQGSEKHNRQQAQLATIVQPASGLLRSIAATRRVFLVMVARVRLLHHFMLNRDSVAYCSTRKVHVATESH